MRVICAPSATDVVYCGIAVDAGTRDELPDENGLAHFCEHLTFKGTHRRRSWHILNRMESVGGDLNAYTGKEETIYYTAFLKEHFARAVDLLADIVLGSTYPQTEMNKEVEVVIDEIESYNDSPSELIFDDFENLIFCGHPLGRNILGEAGRLRGFRSEDIQRFARRLYRPDRMVFFVYGRIEPAYACREITKALKRVASSLPEGHPFQTLLQTDASPARPDRNDAGRTAVPEYRPQTVTLHKDTHQAHVMIGARAYSARDPRHLSLYLLNNILGGPGMNSRLNRELRDNHGYVYAVDSSVNFYRDCGLLSIYFGCDTANVDKCLRIVYDELDRLAQRRFDPDTFEKMRRQYCGQLLVATDNHENYAMSLAKGLLYHDVVIDTDAIIDSLMQTTPDDILEVAQLLAASKSSRLTLS